MHRANPSYPVALAWPQWPPSGPGDGPGHRVPAPVGKRKEKALQATPLFWIPRFILPCAQTPPSMHNIIDSETPRPEAPFTDGSQEAKGSMHAFSDRDEPPERNTPSFWSGRAGVSNPGSHWAWRGPPPKSGLALTSCMKYKLRNPARIYPS